MTPPAARRDRPRPNGRRGRISPVRAEGEGGFAGSLRPAVTPPITAYGGATSRVRENAPRRGSFPGSDGWGRHEARAPCVEHEALAIWIFLSDVLCCALGAAYGFRRTTSCSRGRYAT